MNVKPWIAAKCCPESANKQYSTVTCADIFIVSILYVVIAMTFVTLEYLEVALLSIENNFSFKEIAGHFLHLKNLKF
jgi:hypothetical protein